MKDISLAEAYMLASILLGPPIVIVILLTIHTLVSRFYYVWYPCFDIDDGRGTRLVKLRTLDQILEDACVPPLDVFLQPIDLVVWHNGWGRFYLGPPPEKRSQQQGISYHRIVTCEFISSTGQKIHTYGFR